MIECWYSLVEYKDVSVRLRLISCVNQQNNSTVTLHHHDNCVTNHLGNQSLLFLLYLNYDANVFIIKIAFMCIVLFLFCKKL